jgi:hypothetical protein
MHKYFYIPKRGGVVGLLLKLCLFLLKKFQLQVDHPNRISAREEAEQKYGTGGLLLQEVPKPQQQNQVSPIQVYTRHTEIATRSIGDMPFQT